MASYAGIDAGGSGSRWARLDPGPGGAISFAAGEDGPPIQVAEFGVEESVDRLSALLAGMWRDAPFAGAVVGIAGGDDRGLQSELEAGVADRGVVPPEVFLRVVGDTISGVAAALHDGPGVALFAGTGSFAMARTAAGPLVRIGGRGNRVSDHGSGYRITLAAAEAVLLADEGIAPATAMSEPLCRALAAEDPQGLGLAFLRRTAAEIASGFRAVVDVAEAGDAVARTILEDAATQLAALALAARGRAGLGAEVRVVLGGGTQKAPFYRGLVREALARLGVNEVRSLAQPPAHGAALLAQAMATQAEPLCGWLDG